MRLADPPGAGGAVADADLRAQLTVVVASLARRRGPDVEAALGPARRRAADAVASDPFGCSVDLRFENVEEPAEAVSELVRPSTYADERMLVADVTAFVRLGADAVVESAYANDPGGDGTKVNDQAVRIARRILDACPEVDLADVQVINADLVPMEPDGHKRLRAGVLARSVDVAFQAGVAEALGAENWTKRLRLQASVAAELAALLADLPRRLEVHDSAKRRREWGQRAQSAVAAVANLPSRPLDRQPVLGSAHRAALQRPAAVDDQATRRPDRAKSALERIAGALGQVARNLQSDRRLVGLAGHQLEDVPARLRVARAEGAPIFGGIGDTLPTELETLSMFCARVLTAMDLPKVQHVINSARGDLGVIDEAMTSAAEAAATTDAAAVGAFLTDFGVTSSIYISVDPRPMPPWRDRQATLTCELEHWATAMSALQGWDGEDRRAVGISGRVTVLPTEDGEILPFGLSFFGEGGVLPIFEDAIVDVATDAGVPLRSQETKRAIEAACDALIAYSYEQVRRAQREDSWSPAPLVASPPSKVAESLRSSFGNLSEQADHLQGREAFQSAAVELLLELCGAVENEDPASGLAVQLASINISAITAPDPGSSAELFNAVQVAAMEADRGVAHNPGSPA